jgi:DNA-binding NtrC family response regulator
MLMIMASERVRTTTERKVWKSELQHDPIRIPYLLLAWGKGTWVNHANTAHPIGRAIHLCRGVNEPNHNAIFFDDSLVSRRHAVVETGAAGATVTDLGSKNGTFVDGVCIRGSRATLEIGSVISIGENILCYRCLSPAEIAAISAKVRPNAEQEIGLTTRSPSMALILERLGVLAKSNLEVLFSGESGVGKEVLARTLHDLRGNRGEFIAINCASLPEHLIESELFGYAKGAHSTALTSKSGLIEKAEGGTLFLDEIGDMSVSAQAKLLRFIQDKEYTPLGSTVYRKAKTHIVAATLLQLADPTGGKRGLRPDLAARLGPEPIVIPPLRERKEDIATLTEHFLRKQNATIDSEARRMLHDHDWPANVRELEKRIYVAAVTAAGATIGPEHLPGVLREANVVRVAEDIIRDRPSTGRRRIVRPAATKLAELLRFYDGDVAAVARTLGRQRTLVWRWLREDQREASPTTNPSVFGQSDS